MDPLISSTVLLIAGALLLTLIAASGWLKRRLFKRKKDTRHDNH